MTLQEMSACTQIPVSTLSKVEHDQLTLSFQRLHTIADRLGIRAGDLFSPEVSSGAVTGRRSIERLDEARIAADRSVGHYPLCADLTDKRMTPTLIRLRADSAGDETSSNGEQFLFVLQGAIEVHTRYYEPARLNAGESIYFDSGMRHHFTVAVGWTEAQLLCIHATP
jgi:quercetin dioxygenase-like cupin family protein